MNLTDSGKIYKKKERGEGQGAALRQHRMIALRRMRDCNCAVMPKGEGEETPYSSGMPASS